MKNAFYLILIFLVVAVAACGDSERFAIEGKVEGVSAINLRILYFSNGKVFTGITATGDGKFRFEGIAPKRAIVEIYDNDYRLMGRTIAVNGDRLELTLTPSRPYEISAQGTELAERWAAFLNENADSLSGAAANDFIARYVQANPADELAGLLLITEFDCSGANAAPADSLWNLLAPEIRPADLAQSFVASLEGHTAQKVSAKVEEIQYLASGNRTDTFRTADHPLSLIAVSSGRTGRDTIVKELRSLDSLRRKKKVEILDLSVDADTFIWRSSVRDDSVKWKQGWSAGAIAGRGLSRFAIPAVPYYIALDSTGSQLWRGEDVREAKEFILEYYD